MNAKNILIISTLIVSATSCNLLKNTNITTPSGSVTKTEAVENSSNNNAATHSPGNNNIEALNGKWAVLTIDSVAVNAENSSPYIELEATNKNSVKCYAYDGCNYINGEYKLVGNFGLIQAAEFISTLKSCDDSDYEARMANAINSISAYSIIGDGSEQKLCLKNSAGAVVMTLCKNENESFNGAWIVTSINGNSVDGNDMNLKLVFDIANKSIHGNVGCNTMNGTIVLKQEAPNKISFSNMITTRMACPDMSTELSLLSALESVAEVSFDDSNLFATLVNDAGTPVVTLRRLAIRSL